MTDTYRSFEEGDRDAMVVPKRCFTPIPPSRRFLQTKTLSLCPSMDLMVVGSTSSSSNTHAETSTTTTTLALHRTMNPQKLSHKTLESVVPRRASAALSSNDTNDHAMGHVACCWRSDGRVLAVVVTGAPSRASDDEDDTESHSSDSKDDESSVGGVGGATLHLYAVEEILKEWHASSPMSTTPLSSSIGSCCALTWAFRGKSHPSGELSVEEEEELWNQENVAFPIPLPPSEYHLGYTTESLASTKRSNHTMAHPLRQHRHNHHHHDMVTPHVLPSPSPLSLLALVTVDPTTRQYNLSVYLHGRFPWIVDLPLTLAVPATHNVSSSSMSTQQVQVAISNSLTHVVVALPDGAKQQPSSSFPTSSSSSPLLVAARIPINPTIASFSATTIALEYHLSQLQSKVSEIVAVYVSSLKPLDSKLEALSATLARYSIAVVNPTKPSNDTDVERQPTTLASSLASWMVGSSCNPDLTSALEQYFASVQMNDQLLVRMDQSLTVAMANVESQIHQLLLSPNRAMVVQTSELMGTILAAAPAAISSRLRRRWSEPNDGNNIIGRDQVAVARRVHQLAIDVHQSIEQLHTEVVSTRFLLRDWIQWLRATGSTLKARGTPANSPLHLHAIQRRVPDAITERILTRLQQQSSQPHPSRHQSSSYNRKSGWTEHVLGLTLSQSLEGLPPLLGSFRHELHTLFLLPRVRAKADVFVQPWNLGSTSLSESNPNPKAKLFALTTRLGAGGIRGPRGNTRCSTDPFDTCFVPKRDGTKDIPHHPKEWIITADATPNNVSGHGNTINICALPLDEADDTATTATTAWMTRLQFASSTQQRALIDMAFYGDNGKSSLSAMDGGSGQERRQALALLVENAARGEPSTLELWLVNYDACSFSSVSLHEGSVVDATDSTVPTVRILPHPASGNEGEDYGESQDSGVVFAKSRTLSSMDASNGYRLVVSGSRGVGTVLANSHRTGTTTVDLYDLEEDEEDEDEDDGDDMSTE